jgi:hypothetical protein
MLSIKMKAHPRAGLKMPGGANPGQAEQGRIGLRIRLLLNLLGERMNEVFEMPPQTRLRQS